jgi:hypothetical protein
LKKWLNLAPAPGIQLVPPPFREQTSSKKSFYLSLAKHNENTQTKTVQTKFATSQSSPPAAIGAKLRDFQMPESANPAKLHLWLWQRNLWNVPQEASHQGQIHKNH